jgi:adenylate kinase
MICLMQDPSGYWISLPHLIVWLILAGIIVVLLRWAYTKIRR